MRIYWIAGAHDDPGTGLPENRTGDCPHRHRSARTARQCIVATDRRMKKEHGESASCDRVVILVIDGEKLEVTSWTLTS